MIFRITGLVLSFSISGFAQTLPEPQLLPPGQTIEREMTGAETHRYKFLLKKDEFFQVRLEQKGVDVSLKLLDSVGTVLTTMDSPNSKDGPETLSFVTTISGSYLLEVAGFGAGTQKGAYTVKRELSQTATASDLKRVNVEKIFVEAIAARDTKGQTENAIAKLEQTLVAWKELNEDYLVQLTTQQLNTLKMEKATRLFEEAMGLLGQKTIESRTAARGKFSSVYDTCKQIGNDECLSMAVTFFGKGRGRPIRKRDSVKVLRGSTAKGPQYQKWRG